MYVGISTFLILFNRNSANWFWRERSEKNQNRRKGTRYRNQKHAKKHDRVPAGIESVTMRQTWENGQISGHSGTELFEYLFEFSINKLNPFDTRVTENKKLVYLLVVVLYHDV